MARSIASRSATAVFAIAALLIGAALPYDACADGFLGIDHRVPYDDSGIWSRSSQNVVRYGLVAGALAAGLWQGADDRLGRASWQAVDAAAAGGLISEAGKRVFTRSRPIQSPDPNLWFQGSGHYSFPSTEVTVTAAVVTPYILEYGKDHPAVYAAALLPIYDAVARVKVQAHWQTDVLASLALGGVAGYVAHGRDNPFIVGLLPHGVSVGLSHQF